jgi:DNA polymerase-1
MPEPLALSDPHHRNKKLVLIDGNSLLYRGFFAMRALTTSAGQPTNAVFSFTMMLLTLLTEQRPDSIVCAWDTPAPTFRHEAFTEYKGQRKSAPPELVEQGPLAREMVDAFNISTIEAPGFEADDIIGTLATRGQAQGYDALIVTGDLDALQLVQSGIRVMTTVKGVTDTVIYDDEAVEKRYGLHPDQLADYRALKGDASDNIPGVPGVGEKTATQLLQKFGHVEEMLEHLDDVTPAKLQAALTAATDQIRLAKHLATILRDVSLEGVDLPALDTVSHAPDWPRVRSLFDRLEFRTLAKRIPGGDGAVGGATASPAGAKPERAVGAPDYDPFASDEENGSGAPAVTHAPAPPPDYYDAETPEELAAAVRAARRAHQLAVRLDRADAAEEYATELRGIALGVGDGTAYYVPLTPHGESTPQAALRSEKPAAAGRLTTLSLFDQADPDPSAAADGWSVTGAVAEIPALLRQLLQDPGVAKVTHDAKSDTALLARYGVDLRGVAFDTELAAYLLNAGRRSSFPLPEVAADYAGRELRPLDKKERKERDAASIDAYDKEQALASADALLATMHVQEPRLAAEGLIPVLRTLDLPIVPILAEMELAGLRVDVSVLQRVAAEMQEKISALEVQVFAIAGMEFAIGSTKQLQEVLFDRLKLPAGKKTKTGYSTGADVLEELAPEYPIVSLILQHRELTKLKSTYADAMPALVRPETQRIHTSLNQTVAATGRLSSSSPNLQNIPIRTEIGREIRRAFTAAPGNALVSADYSQIELRIFAHVSHDSELIAAFGSGEDIHTYTAGRIFGVPLADVTTDMRRTAKTTNYAVIYGISDFALGRRLGMSMSAAKELKASYFARFPGVRQYIDDTVAFAREHGYVQTIFGRRRYIPDINSRVFQFRQAAERAAANMPIQGSSADIMKLAMIRVHEALRAERFRSRMLLQVHDELLFEAPDDEVQRLAACVYDAMSHAHPIAVALEVEVKTGRTWADVTPVEDMAVSLADVSA